MKDHNGKRIVLGSTIKCINDVDYGRTYKVKKFCNAHPMLGIEVEGTFMPLQDYETEDGCLIDFEVSKEQADGTKRNNKSVI